MGVLGLVCAEVVNCGLGWPTRLQVGAHMTKCSSVNTYIYMPCELGKEAIYKLVFSYL